MAKLRLFRVPELMAGGFVLAVLGRDLRPGGAMSGPTFTRPLTFGRWRRAGLRGRRLVAERPAGGRAGRWPSRASPSGGRRLLGVHFHDAGLVATAVVVLAVKGVVIPALLRPRRVARRH